jgi:hypothetical protein
LLIKINEIITITKNKIKTIEKIAKVKAKVTSTIIKAEQTIKANKVR